MAAFVEATASTGQLVAWRRHLRVCDSCAAAVARLRTGAAPVSRKDASRPAEAQAGRAVHPVVGLEPNFQIGDFRLERRLGSGGMGVVYQAVQLSLNRRVALKVLPFGPGADAATVERFHREARAAARLRHPNIVTIYAEGAESHVCYFAMEMIEGQNLDEVIRDLRAARSAAATSDTAPPQDSQAPEQTPRDAETGGPARPRCVLRDCGSEKEYFNAVARLVGGVAEALDYAHREGIIHRDVKPSNLMLSHDGRLVLLDFGIARMRAEQAMTRSGSFIGTPRYMSPEQLAAGPQDPNQRCDIYSLGVTLYELLTLEPLFDGNTQERVIGQILGSEPHRPRQINRRIPVDLETICGKAIAKEPGRRYATAGEFAEDLRRYLDGRVIQAKRPGAADRLVKFVRRRAVIVALAAGIVVVSAVAALLAWRHYTTQWAQQHAMARIDQLMEQNEYFAAWRLAEKAQRYLPNDPLLASRWPRLSRLHALAVQPLGAKVYLARYPDRNPQWVYLGRAPIKNARIPFGTYRWRVEKPGFVTLEEVRSNDLPSPSVDPASLPTAYLGFTLQGKGEFPPDMVWIPSSDLSQNDLFHGERLIPAAPAFLIDKYEVTNRQFKDFLDSGGYGNRKFWQEEFIKDGKALTWSQAMELFRDESGSPGPATWKEGTYPRGQADYPAGGISWYEAAAYARFRGKELPTIFHWLQANSGGKFPYRIACYGNFDGAAAPVGRYPGMGVFGLCDGAGNIREWCHNAIEGESEIRSILGGGWSDHEYVFITGEVRSAWDRDAANGLRCAMYVGGREAAPDLAFHPVQRKHRDFAHFKPVSDEVFDSYVNTWYKYDRTELNAKIESVDYDRNRCRRERITFDAAYPDERVIAYLHLPNGVKPPYQVVLWYPGGEARDTPWDEAAHKHEMTTILNSGRALIVPFYKGTYERRLEKPYYRPDGIQSRNLYVQGSQDMRRAIDYLETRADIDAGKLAFVGLSWGGQMGSVMIALEERFKAGVFLLGGICACERHPAADPAHFAPRVKIPILMLNAKEDSIFPYETAQKPLFNLLGTPEPHKKHILFPGGHGIPWEYHEQYYGEIVKWLDQYLGPVDKIDN